MAEEDITINDLAGMVSKGFAGVDKKFEEMDKKIEDGFKTVTERLDKLQNDRMEKLEARMHRIEEALVIK